MSGPYDVPDDPEEVTLWAGRLRAWPTPPVAADDEVDDDTAVSRRAVPDDTVRVDRPAVPAPADDTVRVDRPAVPAPADDTVRVDRPAVPAPADDTVRVAHPAVAGESADRRDRPAPVTPVADEPADDTLRVRPAPGSPEPADETTAPGRRRADAEPVEAPTGDTAAGTRRARAREALPAALPSGDPVPVPREARIPSGNQEVYRPRADAAVRVTRSAAPARADDAPDAAQVRPRAPRRGRGRAVALALTVVVVSAAAVIALFLLMG